LVGSSTISGTGSGPLPPRRTVGSQARSAVAGFVLVWRILRANTLTLAGFIMVVLMAVVAILVVVLPPIGSLLHVHLSILPYPPLRVDSGAYHQSPSSAHWLGTDELGRDMLSLVLAALPFDLFIGLLVAGFGLLLGGALGLVAGFWDRPRTLGGMVSVIILRVTDIFLAFPSLILALALFVVLGRSALAIVVSIMITWWPYYVRLARGEVLAVKHQPYVMAARAAGVKEGRIVLRHVVRNILEPMIVYFTMDIGTVIVTFSTIGFIAGGVIPESTPEWGTMVSNYQNFLGSYPWTTFAPGLAIFVTVLSFSLLGDGLRDILDPRSRRILAQGPATATTPPVVPTANASGGDSG
jgi:peptide/nickel transport system permease protein